MLWWVCQGQGVCETGFCGKGHTVERNLCTAQSGSKERKEKQDGVVYTCNPSTKAVETGRPGIQSHTGVHEILSQEVKGEAGIP